MSANSSAPNVPASSMVLRIAAGLAIALGLFDIIGVIVYIALPVPIFITIAILLLGVLTIVGAVFAWRGAVWGVWLVIVTRFLSLVPVVLSLVADDAPADARVPSTIQLVLTVICIVLFIVALARRRR